LICDDVKVETCVVVRLVTPVVVRPAACVVDSSLMSSALR
jgi:hypothetical protein